MPKIITRINVSDTTLHYHTAQVGTDLYSTDGGQEYTLFPKSENSMIHLHFKQLGSLKYLDL